MMFMHRPITKCCRNHHSAKRLCNHQSQVSTTVAMPILYEPDPGVLMRDHISELKHDLFTDTKTIGAIAHMQQHMK